jgi:hypothetical protein
VKYLDRRWTKDKTYRRCNLVKAQSWTNILPYCILYLELTGKTIHLVECQEVMGCRVRKPLENVSRHKMARGSVAGP